jgi:hypothetical protein
MHCHGNIERALGWRRPGPLTSLLHDAARPLKHPCPIICAAPPRPVPAQSYIGIGRRCQTNDQSGRGSLPLRPSPRSWLPPSASPEMLLESERGRDFRDGLAPGRKVLGAGRMSQLPDARKVTLFVMRL